MEFRDSFHAQGFQPGSEVNMEIIAYRGEREPPQFLDEDEGVAFPSGPFLPLGLSFGYRLQTASRRSSKSLVT
jgi:hypothetical protein